MEKFLAVAKKIAGDVGEIHNLTSDDGGVEIYFSYKDVVFSILRREEAIDSWGRHSLYMYPKARSVKEAFVEFENTPDSDMPLVALHEKHLPPPDVRLLRDLYQAVKNKHLGLDDIFERLLK